MNKTYLVEFNLKKVNNNKIHNGLKTSKSQKEEDQYETMLWVTIQAHNPPMLIFCKNKLAKH